MASADNDDSHVEHIESDNLHIDEPDLTNAASRENAINAPITLQVEDELSKEHKVEHKIANDEERGEGTVIIQNPFGSNRQSDDGVLATYSRRARDSPQHRPRSRSHGSAQSARIRPSGSTLKHSGDSHVNNNNLLASPQSNRQHKLKRKHKSPSQKPALDFNKFPWEKFDLGPKAHKIKDYVIESTIGQGRFGTVKLAHHPVTGEKVAIKVLKTKELNAGDMERLEREITIMTSMHHPNVVRLYHLIHRPSTSYIIMEYCARGDLRQYMLSQGGFLGVSEALKIFRQTLCGLSYCHQRLIIHRDIKPENILLTEDLVPKLGDFGFSRTFNFRTAMETPCGSLSYAAPEVIDATLRGYLGPKSDIWSMGCVLYEMICGGPPFQTDSSTEQDVMRDIRLGRFRENSSRLNKKLAQLIGLMLTPSPKERASLQDVQMHPYMWLDKPLMYTAFVTPLLGAVVGKRKNVYTAREVRSKREKEREGESEGEGGDTDVEDERVALRCMAQDKEARERYIVELMTSNVLQTPRVLDKPETILLSPRGAVQPEQVSIEIEEEKENEITPRFEENAELDITSEEEAMPKARFSLSLSHFSSDDNLDNQVDTPTPPPPAPPPPPMMLTRRISEGGVRGWLREHILGVRAKQEIEQPSVQQPIQPVSQQHSTKTATIAATNKKRRHKRSFSDLTKDINTTKTSEHGKYGNLGRRMSEDGHLAHHHRLLVSPRVLSSVPTADVPKEREREEKEKEREEREKEREERDRDVDNVEEEDKEREEEKEGSIRMLKLRKSRSNPTSPRGMLLSPRSSIINSTEKEKDKERDKEKEKESPPIEVAKKLALLRNKERKVQEKRERKEREKREKQERKRKAKKEKEEKGKKGNRRFSLILHRDSKDAHQLPSNNSNNSHGGLATSDGGVLLSNSPQKKKANNNLRQSMSAEPFSSPTPPLDNVHTPRQSKT